MTLSILKKEYRYSLISAGKGSSVMLAWIAIISAVLISFFAGRRSAQAVHPVVLDLGAEKKTFQYNRTFAEASSRTDHAWRELFPKHGGFFTDEQVAPERSTFSVFHQLHCLNGIREGYWTLHQAATTGQKLDEQGLPMMASPAHIRHCIDLLRQSLMCCADTAVEVEVEGIDGVTGWGTEHYCRNWEELVRWTTNVQSGNQG